MRSGSVAGQFPFRVPILIPLFEAPLEKLRDRKTSTPLVSEAPRLRSIHWDPRTSSASLQDVRQVSPARDGFARSRLILGLVGAPRRGNRSRPLKGRSTRTCMFACAFISPCLCTGIKGGRIPLPWPGNCTAPTPQHIASHWTRVRCTHCKSTFEVTVAWQVR